MLNKLIINADDFGCGSNVNAAILRSFKEGWVSSATIMANMPGFEEACEIINQYNLYDHIGLHFVLTEGVPLTDEIRRHRRFCDEDGEFRNTRENRLFHLTADEKEAVGQELRTQISLCRENGLRLTHVDSHHNIHEEIGIIRLIVPVMREFRIPYIRIMNNLAESCSMCRRIYTRLYNTCLRYRSLDKTDYFGSIDQYLSFTRSHSAESVVGKRFEIMTHPKLDGDRSIVDALSGRSMERLIEEADLCQKPVSFSGAAYAPNS